MTLTLRPVGAEALDLLTPLYRSLGQAHGHPDAPDAELREKLRLMLTHGHAAALIERAGAQAGYVITRDAGDHVFIRNFLIVDAMRGQGLGRQAFALLQAQWPGRQFRLDASLKVAHPRAFWEKMGFEPVAWSMRRNAPEAA